MKRTLRTITLIIFALMAVCCLRQPVQAASHEDFSLFDYEQRGGKKFVEGDYQYIIIDQEAYITDVDESFDLTQTSLTGHVTIPSQLGGYPVTFLYGMSFSYCNEITEVTVPDSVVTIGFNCFRECKKLTTVNIGANVTTFIGQAFYECPSFTTINWGPTPR